VYQRQSLARLTLSSLLLAATTAAIIVFTGSASGTSARLTASPRFAPNELLVKFKPGTSPHDIRAALWRADAHRVGRVHGLGVSVVRVPDGLSDAALAALQQTPAVVYAERNPIVQGFAVPNDYWWPSEWSQIKVNAPKAWDTTTGTSGAVIAVVDTGVDLAQPDLQGSFVPGYDTVNGDSDPSDDDGHGTLVAGVAAARGNNTIGVASYCWNCSLMPVKGLGAQLSGTTAQAAAGITWAADHGARVINMSWGTTSDSSTLSSAINYAHSKGVVLVAAAGNYGTTGKVYPAAYPSVIGVAGTDGTDSLYSWSSYGSWVKVAAPGCNYTTGRSGWYGTFCGTSSASPAVAGIAGLLVSQFPNATNTQIEQAIESSAVNVGSFVQYGRVDAAAALAAMGGGSTGGGGTTGTAPSNTDAPTITGTSETGRTLSANAGAWDGSTPVAYGYQWRRCDAAGLSCADVAGATTSSYVVSSSDVGSTIRVAVTGSNAYGSSSAVSLPTSVVVDPTPAAPSSTTATFSGSLSKKQTSRAYPLTVGTGVAHASLSFNRSPSLTLTVLAADGSIVGTASGPSVLTLIESLPAGSYSYRVGGGSGASFTLTISYPTP
jgi:subtilisin family serine protease